VDGLRTSDPALYQELFQRAAELKDLEGVLGGAADAYSIRLSLFSRPACVFCRDPVLFAAWVKKHLPYLGEKKLKAVDEALWAWTALSPAQKEWAAARGKSDDWSALSFGDRHELMRTWALGERDALLAVDAEDPTALAGLYARVGGAQIVVGSHEMTEVWRRLEQIQQASSSLAEARAKVGRSEDPRHKALLAEAVGATDPEARLAALSRLFESLGERPRKLLEAAPPRSDQRFDDSSRAVVGAMLKIALLAETEGTFAGQDLKEFYVDRGVPLQIKFSSTSMSALGWYDHGTDVLNFNERHIEQYMKSRGISVQDLAREPMLIGDVARTLVGTFVHEAQHHRQDVWARDNKVPRLYHQGDEVEAFQVQALFLMEKLDRDPRFRAFAESEGAHSGVLQAGLGRARRMKEEGPDYFEWVVPSAHYPEILSNVGKAWCFILWHNHIAEEVESELTRRRLLPGSERARLESAPSLKDGYSSHELFVSALPGAGSGSLRVFAAKARAEAERTPEIYAKLKARQESLKAVTMARFKRLQSGERNARRDGPPSPAIVHEAVRK
jgi:hypothetical protein